MKQTFSERIRIVDKGDIIATGRFEVTIKETKELIHSKKGGMGWPRSEEVKQDIADKIKEALMKLDKQRA